MGIGFGSSEKRKDVYANNFSVDVDWTRKDSGEERGGDGRNSTIWEQLLNGDSREGGAAAGGEGTRLLEDNEDSSNRINSSDGVFGQE